MKKQWFKYKKAFTIIEIMVVMIIILTLFALIIPKLSKAQNKALQASCISNIKNISQALILYTSNNNGLFQNFTKNSSTLEVYGALFEKKGWNNLNNLVCPNNKHKEPPVSQGFNNTLIMPSNGQGTIDYWPVYLGNTNSNNNISLFDVPATNVLIIEKFSGISAWTDADNHQSVGGTVAKINGQAKFTKSFPTNRVGSSSITISKADCST